MDYEFKYIREGKTIIIGMDEAGYGAWAGPVAAGAVCLPLAEQGEALLESLRGVKDSKQMTPRQREAAFDLIDDIALGWGVGYGEPDMINQHGLVYALTHAFETAYRECLKKIGQKEPDMLLLDGVRVWSSAPLEKDQVERIPKGDTMSLTIAAASVMAKVSRDRLMSDIGAEFPLYDFQLHKGYGTATHLAAIEKYGIIENIHRRNYKPIARLLD